MAENTAASNPPGEGPAATNPKHSEPSSATRTAASKPLRGRRDPPPLVTFEGLVEVPELESAIEVGGYEGGGREIEIISSSVLC